MAELNNLLKAFMDQEQYTFSSTCTFSISELLGKPVFVIDTPDKYKPKSELVTRTLVATDRTSNDSGQVYSNTESLLSGVMLELVVDKQFDEINALVMPDEILIWTKKTAPRFIDLEDISHEQYRWLAVNVFPRMRKAFNTEAYEKIMSKYDIDYDYKAIAAELS